MFIHRAMKKITNHKAYIIKIRNGSAESIIDMASKPHSQQPLLDNLDAHLSVLYFRLAFLHKAIASDRTRGQ